MTGLFLCAILSPYSSLGNYFIICALFFFSFSSPLPTNLTFSSVPLSFSFSFSLSFFFALTLTLTVIYITDTLNCVNPTPAPSSSSDSGLSAGSGLLIAFFCLLAVYVLGGMAYNYRAGAKGIEMLPNLSFWRAVPGLITDGLRFSFVECFGLRRRGEGYTPVNSGGERGYGAL